MIAINPKAGKKYCDLFCYMCEGYMLKPCIMTTTGESMRMIMADCLGHGILLDLETPSSEYWREHRVLTPEIVENTGEFPEYVLQTNKGPLREKCH